MEATPGSVQMLGIAGPLLMMSVPAGALLAALLREPGPVGMLEAGLAVAGTALAGWSLDRRRRAGSPATEADSPRELLQGRLVGLAGERAQVLLTVTPRGRILTRRLLADGAGAPLLGDRLPPEDLLLDLVAAADRSALAAFLTGAGIPGDPPSVDLSLCSLRGPAHPVRLTALGATHRARPDAPLQLVVTDRSGTAPLPAAPGQREDVEAVITHILKMFAQVTAGRLDQALDQALDSIGQLTCVDRCHLVRLDETGLGLDWRYQWCAPGVAPLVDDDLADSLAGYPWCVDRLARGQVLLVPEVRDLPAEAQPERAAWQRHGVRSALMVPLMRDERITGMFCFNAVDEPADWDAGAVRLLEALSDIMAGAWQRQEAESRLGETSRRLADIIEFLPDPTFVIDQDRRVVAWNRAMEEISGVPKKEMIGKGDHAYAVPFYGEPIPVLIDHFGGVDLGRDQNMYSYIDVKGETLYAESFAPFMNGGRGAYLWLTASPLFDDAGRIVGAIESLRDITFRKRGEEALRVSEERFRRLVETMNDGLGSVSADGRITYVNDRLCAMAGGSADDFQGRPLTDFLSGIPADLDLADWEGWRAAPGQALDLDLQCLDGRRLPVRVSPAPLPLRDGRFQGGFALIADMTSIREAEARIRRLNRHLERKVVSGTQDLVAANRALRRSEARYRRIIESLREGYIFYSHDTRGRFTYLSPSCRDILGYATEEEVVRRLQAWIGTPENEGARTCSEQSMLGFRQPAYDLHLKHADGRSLVLEILEVPVFDDRNVVIAVEGLGRDVTETRRNLELVRKAQEQLVEAEKVSALGRLVAGLSHEINTPVGIGVTASSHLDQQSRHILAAYRDGRLRRSEFEEFLESARESSELIQANLNRAADLLQNFKLVATDQTAGQGRTFALCEYLDDVLRSVSPRFRNTGFAIRKDCPGDLQLHCDPGALYQVLSNLLMNSLIHGFDGMLVGQITLKARRRGDAVVLEYADNGNGMTREQVARVYEPFYTTKRGRGGSGLGMHIVYNNVTQNLGGTITCASKLGRGTRFTLTVPLPAEVCHG